MTFRFALPLLRPPGRHSRKVAAKIPPWLSPANHRSCRHISPKMHGESASTHRNTPARLQLSKRHLAEKFGWVKAGAVFVALVAGMAFWFCYETARANRQAAAVAAIRQLGGSVYYSYQQQDGAIVCHQLPTPGWLRSITSEDFLVYANTVLLPSVRLESSDLQHLRSLHGLEQLNLLNCPISDRDLAIAANIDSLEELSLTHTSVTDAGMKHLRALSRLKVLHLRRTNVGDQGLAVLSPLLQLCELDLAGTAVTDQGIATLAHLPLRKLTLQNTALTDQGLAILAKIPTLELLDLTGTGVTPHGMEALLRANPQVKIVGAHTIIGNWRPPAAPK